MEGKQGNFNLQLAQEMGKMVKVLNNLAANQNRHRGELNLHADEFRTLITLMDDMGTRLTVYEKRLEAVEQSLGIMGKTVSHGLVVGGQVKNLENY